MPDRSPEVIELVEAAVEDLQERFGGAIERGQAAGEIAAAVDPVQAAAALLMHSGAARESMPAAVARQAEVLLPSPA